MDVTAPPSSTASDLWLVRQPSRPRGSLRLFCFPHAGGNAWAFRSWAAAMPEQIEVCAVQLPGHGHRIREVALHDFEVLLWQLAEAVAPELARPYAFFGHSLGALLAFELARRLRDRTGAEPRHLFVSGCNAPHLPKESDDLSQGDDEAIIGKLQELNCSPPQVLQNRELMALMLPVLRADFAVYQSYVYRPSPLLRCPITVFAGWSDPRTAPDGIEAWRQHTSGRFAVQGFPGDHFFVATEERAVVRTVVQSLLDTRQAGHY